MGRNVPLISAVVYTSIAAAAALTFLAVTTFTGDYGATARFGGAAWVFLLSMIVLMPTVPGVVRRLLGNAGQEGDEPAPRRDSVGDKR